MSLQEVEELRKLYEQYKFVRGKWRLIGEKLHILPDTARHRWIALLKQSAGAQLKTKPKTVEAGIKKDTQSILQHFDPTSLIFRSTLLGMLRTSASLEDLLEKFKVDKETLLRAIDSLRTSGYGISSSNDIFQLSRENLLMPQESLVFDIAKLYQSTYKFLLLSDTHLGNKYARLDVLQTAYEIASKEGIADAYHAGNIVDGESRFNQHELLVHGITDQAYFCLDNYPQVDGITTYFITADDHEGWWQQREGLDFGRYLMFEAQNRNRKDLVHLGYQEVDIELKASAGSAIMRLAHPGGGTSYAISYALQKIVESLQGGEKPQVYLVGHYHKMGYFYPREVHSILAGTCVDQTVFMRKNKLQAHVGFWIIELQQSNEGIITSFKPTFYPFYDRSYYIKRQIFIR